MVPRDAALRKPNGAVELRDRAHEGGELSDQEGDDSHPGSACPLRTRSGERRRGGVMFAEAAVMISAADDEVPDDGAGGTDDDEASAQLGDDIESSLAAATAAAAARATVAAQLAAFESSLVAHEEAFRALRPVRETVVVPVDLTVTTL